MGFLVSAGVYLELKSNLSPQQIIKGVLVIFPSYFRVEESCAPKSSFQSGLGFLPFLCASWWVMCPQYLFQRGFGCLPVLFSRWRVMCHQIQISERNRVSSGPILDLGGHVFLNQDIKRVLVGFLSYSRRGWSCYTKFHYHWAFGSSPCIFCSQGSM